MIVGAGLAGATAVENIRKLDPDVSILLIGREKHLPYHRPPLSKKLWAGKVTVGDIKIQAQDFYDANNIIVELNTEIAALDIPGKAVTSIANVDYEYEKLLIATGAVPRKLEIPGGNLSGVVYYRDLDDFIRLRQAAVVNSTAVVIGGGYIGPEIAASLHENGVDVTLVIRGKYPAKKILPKTVGFALSYKYTNRGIKILTDDEPVSIEKTDENYITATKNGAHLTSDIVVVGVGVLPDVPWAQKMGLEFDNGLLVNEFLQTSVPDIYAAGDIANYPDKTLGFRRRVEHWDNAFHQGITAGKNMAGANESYDYLPYFFSDFFDFGFEAVGEVDSRLETYTDWQEENVKGVIYYLKNNQVRGVMMVNIWSQVDAAREIIRKGGKITVGDLRGAIK